MQIAEFANIVYLDEVAHNEPPHLDLHCLPSGLWILNIMWLGFDSFWKFADENFVVCFLVVKELKLKLTSCRGCANEIPVNTLFSFEKYEKKISTQKNKLHPPVFCFSWCSACMPINFYNASCRTVTWKLSFSFVSDTRHINTGAN